MVITLKHNETYVKLVAISPGTILRANLEQNPETYIRINEVTDGKTSLGYNTFNVVRLSDGEPMFIDPTELCAVYNNNFTMEEKP